MFYSNDVSKQEKMNLTKVREVFVHHRLKKKKFLLFLHRSHGLGEIFKKSFASKELLHFWSDLGKIKLSPSWSEHMIFLMHPMITRHRDISNDLS